MMNHLVGLGQRREEAAVERWLFAHCDDFFRELGLPDGWWCGLNLRRVDVFGDSVDLSGDVDLIAGPLEMAFTPTEWSAWCDRVDREHPAVRLNLGDGGVANLARHFAGDEGRVVWPPNLDHVVGCEAKASFFKEGWKRTHVSASSAQGLEGQLRYLVRAGLDRVGFLHLASTAPPEREDWDEMFRRVDTAWPTFPGVLPQGDPELVGVGHFVGLMGAMPGFTEDFAGSHEWEVRVPCASLPPRRKPWASELGARLGRLPRPDFFRCFILPCPQCDAWRISRGSSRERSPCSCTSA